MHACLEPSHIEQWDLKVSLHRFRLYGSKTLHKEELVITGQMNVSSCFREGNVCWES